ncbi:hypothetical protein OIDMADRAFT_32356 [Oidiodendron maius Zn]|uniref:SRR1-like domain-containing protein n=1 Tax=Oidiodendron maius (strain Zn) TaxID=913774 RepID=A0A0C3H4G4_OIDMZ|nr:hypothetical protein OIDMADRAFT_32356 [Oidiodendron maius Zn]
MSESREDKRDPTQEPWLDYKCSPWTTSSQRAADLYYSGAKLWRKEDLVDIEQQLTKAYTAEKFTLRRLDGNIISIKNPMFGVLKPIWEPVIKFQEFWRLVRSTPDGPPETYHCTYLVDWVNQTVRDYEGPLGTTWPVFESSRERWNASMTCDAFTAQLRRLLLRADGTAKRVTKIVCFGLGDLNIKPKDWWRIQNNEMPPDQRKLEASIIDAALIHHAMALTIADIVRSCADSGSHGVRILSQDPNYIDQTKELLLEAGIEVVGTHGAGGFAEVDSESIVLSALAQAPIQQIIADLARPVAIVYAGNTSARVFDNYSSVVPLLLLWF